MIIMIITTIIIFIFITITITITITTTSPTQPQQCSPRHNFKDDRFFREAVARRGCKRERRADDGGFHAALRRVISNRHA